MLLAVGWLLNRRGKLMKDISKLIMPKVVAVAMGDGHLKYGRVNCTSISLVVRGRGAFD